MGQVKTASDIKRLGTILSVWAHPDDESFTSAGIMTAAIANGQQVICVTATKGEAGIRDENRWPADKLAKIRAEEMQAACKILGITEHFWLGYHDGDCDKVPDSEGRSRVKEFIDKFQPDAILTFGPEGMTGHPDHQSVSRWVSLATEGTNIQVYHAVENKNTYEKYLKDLDKKFNIYFNIDKPPLCLPQECDIAFELTPELAVKKRSALLAQPSQTEAMLSNFPKDAINELFACECYKLAT